MTTRYTARRIEIGARTIPVALGLIAVYALSRVFSTGLLAAIDAIPQPHGVEYLTPGPGFTGFLTSWDSLWYERIALHGYPVQLPLEPDGDVAYNPWAFFPLFPLLVRAAMIVTGLGFPIAAMIVATLFGGAAVFALHRVILRRFGARAAWWGSVLFCFGPMSWLLQLGYAESTFLFFLFAALAAMMRRRYILMIPFAVLASFAHPGALALAVALGIKALIRLVRRQHIGWREWVAGSLSIALIVLAGIAWPLIAGAVTGDPSAYFDTEFAWWADFIGRPLLIPFTPSFLLYFRLFGGWGIVMVAAVIGGFAFWMLRPSARRLGVDLWTFTGSYIGYLAAVFLPTQSLFRMLMPLSPLAGHPGLTATPRRRWITLAVSLVLQATCIELFWVIYPP